ncbi:MAG: response regulator, partial [Calditrichaeota bacterium]
MDPIKVLIVEDVFLIQRLIERYIKPYGEIHKADNGVKALALFTEHFFNGEPFKLI